MVSSFRAATRLHGVFTPRVRQSRSCKGLSSLQPAIPFSSPFDDAVRYAGKSAIRSHRTIRAMARPGLEPGTPRFSVVTSWASRPAKSVENKRFSRGGPPSRKFAVCGLSYAVQGMDGDSSHFYGAGRATDGVRRPGCAGSWG